MPGGLAVTPRPLALYGVFGNVAQQNHFATHLALTALAFLNATARLMAVLALSASDYRLLPRHFYAEDSGDIRDQAHRALLRALHGRLLFAQNAELIDPKAFLPSGARVTEQPAFNARLRQFAPIADVEYRHAALLAQAGQLAAAKAQFMAAARAYPDEARDYAQRLVLMPACDPNTGKLAVFALDTLQRREAPR